MDRLSWYCKLAEHSAAALRAVNDGAHLESVWHDGWLIGLSAAVPAGPITPSVIAEFRPDALVYSDFELTLDHMCSRDIETRARQVRATAVLAAWAEATEDHPGATECGFCQLRIVDPIEDYDIDEGADEDAIYCPAQRGRAGQVFGSDCLQSMRDARRSIPAGV